MSDMIGRLKTALEGRYRLERELGEGGMASVYLAEDVKHERRVAVKVLKPELAAVLGGERFLTEIKTTANLQHPHILPLFDSGEADGFLYYVMPYIEGENLRERIEREGQLGVEEAVRIAREVADALDYAHRKDIIHRDIKPANILLHDGRPVVADFGIALAISAAGGGRMTETGLSLGTPHYMSPEQASADRDLTARSDVYSLGCVLYEMLAGQPPHTGPSAQSILVRILTEDPREVSELRRTAPAHVAAAVMKAIEKLPADRFDSAREFSEALDDPTFRYTPGVRTRPAQTPAHRPAETTRPVASWPLSALGGLTVALAAVSLWGWLGPESPERVIRTDLHLGELVLPELEHIVVSADGSTFAMAGADENGRTMLYVRGLEEPAFRPIPGTEGAAQPTFSPGSDWIAYRDVDADALMKVSLGGGQPLTVVDAEGISAWIPHWGDDGTIVFTGPQGFHRVPETGGTPTPLPADGLHPRLLPGGRGVLFTEGEAVQLLDLATDSVRTLIGEGINATYLPTGHLLYAHPAGGLQAVPFDLEAMEVSGEPVPVQDGVGNVFTGAYYSVSDEGTLVYVTGRGALGAGEGDLGRLTLVDVTSGATEPVPLEPRTFELPRYSPDGRFVAYASGSPSQIFVYDMELGTTPIQLTFEGENRFPVWSPDGTRLAFTSRREGSDGYDLYVKTAHDDTPESLIVTRPAWQGPFDWPAEDLLVFDDLGASASLDLWVVDPSGDGDAEPYLTAEVWLTEPNVSPDGRLVAYTSDEGGERAIYVRSFPEPRQQRRVSRGGGQGPRWSPDGNTIYYWSQPGSRDTLFAARVRTEPSFAVLSTDVILSEDGYDRPQLDAHPDGERLLVVVDRLEAEATVSESEEDGGEPERYIAVFNWFEELRQRMGGRR